jgi:hypothetical protein
MDEGVPKFPENALAKVILFLVLVFVRVCIYPTYFLLALIMLN